VEEDIYYVYHLLNTITLMVDKARQALDSLRRRYHFDLSPPLSGGNSIHFGTKFDY
jgi:hypothetical protein